MCIAFMLIRQSKNTFIRSTNRYGYITNQLTHYDRTYNDVGADFLRQISREPKDINDIVNELLNEYEGVTFEELKADFLDFVDDLEKTKFIVTGENNDELDKKDISFTYAIDNPKTLADVFSQQTNQGALESTQDFFLEEVQGRPLISCLQFELSSRCNERCIHCYIPNEKKSTGFDMPLSKVKNILDEFADMGGIHVTLSGGEAFLHKDLIEISENAMNNNDNEINENDKNEYLLIKEKNNKLTNELSKLKNIIKNLKDSKEKIIEIYEDEINKLNNFHKKAKEKTMNNKKEKLNIEIDEEKLMKIIHENEEIKNENFELIKDLDKLAELQKIYQGLIDENSKLKNELKDSDLNEENQKSLNDAIGDDNLNEEEENKNDSN